MHSHRQPHIHLCLIVVLGRNLDGCYIVPILAAYAAFLLVFVFVSWGGRQTYTQTA